MTEGHIIRTSQDQHEDVANPLADIITRPELRGWDGDEDGRSHQLLQHQIRGACPHWVACELSRRVGVCPSCAVCFLWANTPAPRASFQFHS